MKYLKKILTATYFSFSLLTTATASDVAQISEGEYQALKVSAIKDLCMSIESKRKARSQEEYFEMHSGAWAEATEIRKIEAHRLLSGGTLSNVQNLFLEIYIDFIDTYKPLIEQLRIQETLSAEEQQEFDNKKVEIFQHILNGAACNSFYESLQTSTIREPFKELNDKYFEYLKKKHTPPAIKDTECNIHAYSDWEKANQTFLETEVMPIAKKFNEYMVRDDLTEAEKEDIKHLHTISAEFKPMIDAMMKAESN